MTLSVFDRIVRRFTSDDVTRPQFRDPWQSATGEVLATDGKIAIVHRQPPPNNYPKEDPGYRRSRATGKLVHSYGDESPADFDVLRFGEKGGVK